VGIQIDIAILKYSLAISYKVKHRFTLYSGKG